MYLCVDVGGTKTLLAAFTDEGELTQEVRYETPASYPEFLAQFETNFRQFSEIDFRAAAVAVPGRIDRQHGRVVGYGTLKWGPAPIEQDIENLAKCPAVIENDAKLAGLSEAILIKNEFKRVLYVTIGTGISDAVVMDGILDPAFLDSEGGQQWLDFQGKKVQWEDFASGSAIFKRYGKKATDIHESETWKEIAHNLAVGLINLIVIVEPEVIVIGGGVGSNFKAFIEPLEIALKKYETSLTPIPPLRQAQRPEQAVIYGCYELVRQKHGSNPQ